jgi:simple sugar transport system permease protein
MDTAALLLSDNRAVERARVRQERRRATWIDLLVTLGTIVIALLIGFIVTLAVGKEPIKAYTALLTGPLSQVNRLGNWLQDATTLILIGLSVSIAFQARQFNLGAEGQLYIGALVAAVVALAVPLPPVLGILVPLLAAMAAGFLLGLVPGWMKAYLNANEIVSTLMINAIIANLYQYLLINFLTPAGENVRRTAILPANSAFPLLADIFNANLGRANLAIVLVLLAVIAVWVLMRRTPFGYEIRMIGANEKFAQYGGINTRRVIMLAFAIGGAVAAIGGVHLAMGVHNRLILGISAGLGFEGIVVAMLARNNPLLVPITGLFYSYLRVGGDIMERTASVGAEIVQVIQAVIILLITAQFVIEYVRTRRNRRAAEANAAPTIAEAKG